MGCNGLAQSRQVRVLRRHGDAGGVDGLHARGLERRIDSRHHRLAAERADLAEERNPLGDVSPVAVATFALPPRRLVPTAGPDRIQRAAVVGEVVVVLAVVEGRVAVLPEQFRHRRHARRERDLIAGYAPRAMVVGAGANRVDAGDVGGARRAAHRYRRVGPLEDHAFARQRIDVGRRDPGLAVRAVPRMLVLDVDPQDVRRGDACGGEEREHAGEERLPEESCPLDVAHQ